MLWVGRIVCGLDYVIEGRDNIPAMPSVIMIKHTTVFETYAQLAIFPPQTWVVKRELQWIPLFGWGVAAMRPIAINRSAGHTAVTQVIEQGRDRLAKGIWITVFPEGTRTRDGSLGDFRAGALFAAKRARVPIVPAAIRGTFEALPTGTSVPRPHAIRLRYGPPIDGEREDAMELARQAILARTRDEPPPAV